MPFPYDENFEEDSGVFHDENERPTLIEGRRRRKRELAEDRDYQHGRMIKAIIEIRRDIDELMALRTVQPPPARPSIKPQVTTAGVSVGVSTIIAIIYQLLHQAGVLK
jgi:hypothetical protein